MPRLSKYDIEGFRVSRRTKRSGQAVLVFRVLDPITKIAVMSKEFDSEKTGCLWARFEAKLLRERNGSAQAQVDVLANEVFDQMSRKSIGYRTRIKNVGESLARAGIRDLKARDFGVEFVKWLGRIDRDWYVSETKKRQTKNYKPLTDSTLDGLVRALRRIITYAQSRRDLGLTWDPLVGCVLPKPQAATKETFTTEEVRAVLNGLAAINDPWFVPMALLFYTGCRIAEAMHLRWEFVNWDDGIIDVRKGDYRLKFAKERWFHLQPELREILTAEHLRLGRPRDGYIIASERMRHSGSCLRDATPDLATSATYVKAFRLAFERAGCDHKKRAPHHTRHTHIAHMLATGVGFDGIMYRVGHAQSATTEKYGSTRDRYLRTCSKWPRGILCYRHPHDSAFHNPDEFTEADPVVIVGMG